MRFAIAVAALVAAGSASAQGIKGTGTYGLAGCGLGSMVFGNQAGAVQILAATTNNIIFPQTFAISTGTSNCQPGAFASGTRDFVDANREAVAKDVSRGSGESIGAITQINACQDSTAVGAALQQNFATIFPSETATVDEVTQAILQVLHSDPALGCGRG